MGQRKWKLLACFSLVVVLLVACGERKETGFADNTADGLVLDAYKQKDYPLLLSLADSLEKPTSAKIATDLNAELTEHNDDFTLLCLRVN